MPSPTWTSRTPWALGAGALVLGLLAAVSGAPDRAGRAKVDVTALARIVERGEDHVTALELASWIRDRKPGLRVLDVRSPEEYGEYHIPSAERVDLTGLRDVAVQPNETIVLYSAGGTHAAQGWFFLRALGHPRVYFLRGGLDEWDDLVMHPTLARDATPEARGAFSEAAPLVRYFGGLPRVGDAPARGGDAASDTAASRAQKPGVVAHSPWRRSC